VEQPFKTSPVNKRAFIVVLKDTYTAIYTQSVSKATDL